MEGVMALPSVNQNVHPKFDNLIEQMPSKLKELASELIQTAISCYANIRSIETTIESYNHLEALLPANMNETISIAKVKEVFKKCANIKVNIIKEVEDFVLKKRLQVASIRKPKDWMWPLWPFVVACEESYEQNFEKIWEIERNKVQALLARERMEAVNSFVKNQAMVSAIVILVECYAIHKVWQDVENAENVIETCKRDFPLIRQRLEDIHKDQAQLTLLIQEVIREDTSTLRGNIRTLTFRLIRKVNAARNMINELKIEVNGQIVTIAMHIDDTFRRGVSNGAQAAGGALTLFRLRSNLSAPYVWLQIVMTTAFTLISGENIRLSYLCKAKLKELREALITINQMERLVEETEEVIAGAETKYNVDSTM